MYSERLSIFLSHSHKDIEKVRKIRDILETLNCEPILFFLKCLDDNNSDLEEFIKREIAARNVFLYCKSENSENSIWVQKELEYIKSFDESRLYTVDLESEFAINLVEVLRSIIHLISRNTVVICCSIQELNRCENISKELKKRGYITRFYHPQIDGIPSMKTCKEWEFTKLHDQYELYFETEIIPQMEKDIVNGILLVMESDSLNNGDWSSYMMGKIIKWCQNNDKNVIYVTQHMNVLDIIHAVRQSAIQ